MDEIYELLKNSLFEYLGASEERQTDLMNAYALTKVTNRLISSLESHYEGCDNLTPLEENIKLCTRKGKFVWRLSEKQISSRRSLAGSVNDLLASVSSSEMNEKVSEEKGTHSNLS